MGNIIDASSVEKRMAEGKGTIIPLTITNQAAAASSVNSGNSVFAICGNTVGASFPTTLPQIRLPEGTNPMRLVQARFNGTTLGGFIGQAYRLGTLNLAATGDQFTHDSATFPVNRTNVFGTDPVSGFLMIHVTTATSVTAPIFRLRNNAGTQGYTNQAGASVIGAKNFTFPATAVAQGACYSVPVEDGDSGIRDLTAIEVTTASSTGEATVYLVEMLAPILSWNASIESGIDTLRSPCLLPDLRPAVATSGTASSNLWYILWSISGIGSSSFSGAIMAVSD